jgi:MOSC domain-containing protein YiiM
MAEPNTLQTLTQQFASNGHLDAIFLRPARGEPCLVVKQANAIAKRGLEGDRSSQKVSAHPLGGKRQITLIQAEHIAVIAALTKQSINPAWLKRNLVISGINLIATKSLFKDQPLVLTVGDCEFEITGPCEPCSKMEKTLGHGGYNAMRGHGGVTARILKGGILHVGDSVSCAVRLSA